MNLEFKLPALGENITGGDVVSILVREGDIIATNDGVVEVETDKSVVEVACPYAGTVTRVLVAKGQTVEVGQPLLQIDAADANPEAAAPQPTVRAAKSRQPADEPKPESTEGVPAQRGSREPAIPPGVLSEDAYGPVRREPLSRIRRAVAAHVVKSAATIPHVTHFDDADVTELERMCKTIPPTYLGPTVKLSTTAFALKAIATALRQHPALNAALDQDTEEIVYKQYVHIGILTDTPRGPLVPVLRHVDRLGVVEIARELTLLAARARSAEFALDELRGGTFTVSNLGPSGGVYGTPIVNHPEVAAILLGRSRWLLGVHEGKIEGRLMLPLSVSFDPRIVDTNAAARFLADLIDYLQSPGKLLLIK